jgi:hypothetical protein
MVKRLTIGARYGRDYKNGAEAKEAFLSGTVDFTALAMNTYGAAVSLADCQAEGIEEVDIRYKKETQIVNVKIPAK